MCNYIFFHFLPGAVLLVSFWYIPCDYKEEKDFEKNIKKENSACGKSGIPVWGKICEITCAKWWKSYSKKKWRQQKRKICKTGWDGYSWNASETILFLISHYVKVQWLHVKSYERVLCLWIENAWITSDKNFNDCLCPLEHKVPLFKIHSESYLKLLASNFMLNVHPTSVNHVKINKKAPWLGRNVR